MTELELYKFVQDKLEDEIHWTHDGILELGLRNYDFKEFIELLDDNDYLWDDGYTIPCVIHRDMIWVELNDICEQFEINPENILKKPKELLR